MTSKEYLGQAFRLDQHINSMLIAIESLTALAEKCTSVVSDMPKNPNRSTSGLADTMAKIIDLQSEISAAAERLVDLKKEIFETIQSVENSDYRLLLRKRYLNYMKWEAIATDMDLDLRWVLRQHLKALEEVDRIRSQK